MLRIHWQIVVWSTDGPHSMSALDDILFHIHSHFRVKENVCFVFFYCIISGNVLEPHTQREYSQAYCHGIPGNTGKIQISYYFI